MWAQISLKRALEKELKGNIVTDKNIKKYIPETSLKYEVYNGTIEELIADTTKGREPGVIYFVTPEKQVDNEKDEYIWMADETEAGGGHYELIGSTRSAFIDEEGNIVIKPENGKKVEIGTDENHITFNNDGISINGTSINDLAEFLSTIEIIKD